MPRERKVTVNEDTVRLLDRIYHDLEAVEGETAPSIDDLLEKVHETIVAVCPDPVEYAEILRQPRASRVSANGISNGAANGTANGPGRRRRGPRPAALIEPL